MGQIRVEIKLYSILKKFGQEQGLGSQFLLEIEEGTTLDQIREQIGIPIRRIGRYLKQGKPVESDYAPADGETIDFLPPMISGG